MSQAATPRPHLAAAADIEAWAETIMARADLARLIRNLIRQTNDQVTTLRMPGGEGSTIPGYDGVVVAAKGTPFVPEGRSVWELGTGGEPTDKATDDYKKRKHDPLGEDQANTAFVFVTPRSWPNKQKWIDDRKADSPWKDIVVFDVHDIETALDAAPGAHYIFSDQIGKPAFGAQALLEWWNRFSASTNPRLTIEMVLAGREDQAAELLKLLVQDVGRTAIVAASPDDALAFTAATILSSNEDQQLDLFGRAIIVHDSTVLRVLDRTAKLLILLPYDETMLREALLIQNHHVVFLAPPGTPGTLTLKPIDPEPMAGLLRKAGVEEGRARTLAQAASQSLVAFQNAAPARGMALHPQWATFFKSAVVRRAWLAGGWLELRSGDTDVMAELLGQTLEAASEQLREAASGEDPIFVVVASVWGVASPEASWEYLRPHLTRTDFAELEPIVQQVLGAVDPKLELPVDERWQAAIHGKTRIHSDNLRKGLATTLALLGAVGGSAQLGGGSSAQTWAESVVRKLLDRANEDQSGELWTSISDVLPLLAEAAPEQFLNATTKGLQGADPVLRKLFSDKDAAFTTSSAHPSLLWSLESLARSPEHFALAMDALARLVEVDPGGRLGNRPDSTFIGVITPWFPQTSATPDARLAVLDSLRERHPGIAWRLTLGCLPGMLGAGSFNYEPRFRRWGPGNAPVPQQEYWQMVEGIVDDLIEMADQDPDRWPELIKRIPDLPLSKRQAVYERIRGLQIDG